ncbi:cytochrome c maturation protein CcmE [Sphingoaurantiacus capsulatus]|uniref:Cytochrome c-type biogenesis protein CcmE n=1 Tax=Sphingoaurantiacus capsulatus TaxID=1771310 RepID=A0ABV7X755_9SPHN
MKPKQQRMMLLGAALVALAGAGALAASALGDTATYFYSPSDVLAKGVPPGEAIRLGGLVEPGSVTREGATIHFRVTDNAQATAVAYTGIIPDLFREGQGVIAEGKFGADGGFVADSILAKHDENYMPPEVAGALHKTETAGE